MKKNEMGRPIIKAWLLSFAVMIALFLFASGSLAQSTTDGAIGGVVTDSSGAAVPNAKVTVKNLGTNAEEVVTTDETGYFRVGKVQPATYSVSIEASGFAPFKVERVIVQVGSVTDVSAKLNVAAAGATVIVSAEIPQVNTNSAEFAPTRSEEHTSELQSRLHLVCRLLLEKKKKKNIIAIYRMISTNYSVQRSH